VKISVEGSSSCALTAAEAAVIVCNMMDVKADESAGEYEYALEIVSPSGVFLDNIFPDNGTSASGQVRFVIPASYFEEGAGTYGMVVYTIDKYEMLWYNTKLEK